MKPSFDNDLTKRELEICGMIAQGFSSKSIAAQLYLSKGTVKNYITSIYQKKGVKNRAELAATYALEYEQAATDIDTAGLSDTDMLGHIGPKLRLARLNDSLPDVISLVLQGQPFIIGRFNINIGFKQCDFEFSKNTKAVSRRHASIELTARGYLLRDLNSSAGTFVNGKRIIADE